MSTELRLALAEQIADDQPRLGQFLQDRTLGIPVLGSWDFISYSFQRGFEELWDRAKTDMSGLMVPPLLSLWRQSIELCLKASIQEVAGTIGGKPGHNLEALFETLAAACSARGVVCDDDLTDSVRDMIRFAQTFDPYADRFRYPETRKGQSYPSIDVDLDALFQAHWLITGWCEGTALEVTRGN